jgi:hypothetical protein
MSYLIHSARHEAHIAHLRHAIQRTHRAGLALNPKKCIFGSTTVEYLGHTILSDGVRPGKDKTQAMKDITEPKTKKLHRPSKLLQVICERICTRSK